MWEIGGAFKGAKGDEFWVEEAGETGAYALKLEHNDYNSCTDTNTSGKVFKFEFDLTKTNDNGSFFPAVGGEVTRSDSGGWVNAPKTTIPVSNDSAGYVEWYYDMKVITEPSGLYSGNVDATGDLTFTSDGRMRIYCFPRPVLYDTFGISVNWGIVTVSMSALWGIPDYGDSIAGADLETKIGDLVRVQLGDVEHNSEEVTCSMGIPKVEVWDDSPGDGVNLSVNRTDNQRTYTVGSTANEVIFKVGAGSDISLFIAPEGTWVPENKQTIDSVTAVEEDGVFDIVP